MRRIKAILGSKFIIWMAILYSVAITVLFFIPTEGLPSVGGSGFDKIVHFLFFFALVILWQLVIFKNNDDELPRKMIFFILGFTLVYGILIEVFQELLTASRTADPFDVVADFLGALIGVLVFNKVKHLFKT